MPGKVRCHCRRTGKLIDRQRLEKKQSNGEKITRRWWLFHLIGKLHFRKVVIHQRMIFDVSNAAGRMIVERVFKRMQRSMPHLHELVERGRKENEGYNYSCA